eukprot:EG_transcript_5599
MEEEVNLTEPTATPSSNLQAHAHPVPSRQQLLKELVGCIVAEGQSKSKSKSKLKSKPKPAADVQLYSDSAPRAVQASTLLAMRQKFSGSVYHAATPRLAAGALSSLALPAAAAGPSAGAGQRRPAVAADVHSVLFAVFAEHGVVGCEQVVNGEAVGALYLFELRKATDGDAAQAIDLQLWDLTVFMQRNFMKKKVILEDLTFDQAAEHVSDREQYRRILGQLVAAGVVQATTRVAEFLGFICRLVHYGDLAARLDAIFEDPGKARADTAQRLRREKHHLMAKKRPRLAAGKEAAPRHVRRERAKLERGSLESVVASRPGRPLKRLKSNVVAVAEESGDSDDDVVEVTQDNEPSESEDEEEVAKPQAAKVEGVDFFVNAKGESTEVGDLVAIDPYPPNQWLARVEGLCVVDGRCCFRIRWYEYVWRPDSRRRHYRAVSDDRNSPEFVPETLATVDQIVHGRVKGQPEVWLSPKEFRAVEEQFQRVHEGTVEDDWDWSLHQEDDDDDSPETTAAAQGDGYWAWAPEPAADSSSAEAPLPEPDCRAAVGVQFLVDAAEDAEGGSLVDE